MKHKEQLLRGIRTHDPTRLSLESYQVDHKTLWSGIHGVFIFLSKKNFLNKKKQKKTMLNNFLSYFENVSGAFFLPCPDWFRYFYYLDIFSIKLYIISYGVEFYKDNFISIMVGQRVFVSGVSWPSLILPLVIRWSYNHTILKIN